MEKNARKTEAINIPNLRYLSLSNLFEILFDGDFKTMLDISMVVPSGQIQLQKNLPRKTVRNKMSRAGQNNQEMLRFSIKSNKGISGLKRRNRSEDNESS